ncbi:MAG TPA: 4'-phosphopantetheinyl transferase superfamily protein [Solirubrobacteraceae bacterium]|nr:4'-phosphopantetheinyl transferase superfamily protein [Solirubrobacteraceae bacterium]
MGDPVRALEAIMPKDAVCVEIFREGAGEDYEPELFPAELEAIEGSTRGRRREFAAGRSCARRALQHVGVSAGSIPMGKDGAPLWPRGIVGSITHKRDYRAAVAARSTSLAAIGLDAELNEPLPATVLNSIALPDERTTVARLLETLDGIAWDRLLFSAKEAALKAAYWLAAEKPDLRSTSIELDAKTSSFRARPAGRNAGGCTKATPELTGRWVVRGELLTVVASAPVSTQSETHSSSSRFQ